MLQFLDKNVKRFVFYHFRWICFTTQPIFITRKHFILDKSEIDTDQTYDSNTGNFKLPVTGMYGFTWKLCVDSRVQNNEQIDECGSQLIIGGQIKLFASRRYRNIADGDSSTGFVIKYITKIGGVYLRSTNAHQGALISNTNVTCTTFSGWKLD